MEESYARLLRNNKAWAEKKIQDDPEYFRRLAAVQQPDFLWIGCSDSRVPPNEITETLPGEIFVHRNIANMVVHTDFNLLSILQFSIEVLHVKHVIVCGHYGCSGVRHAMLDTDLGLVNNWLRNIKDVFTKYRKEIEALPTERERMDRLVELNVVEQVRNLGKTAIVQRAWKNRTLKIHGWIYDMENGRIKDLNVLLDEIADLEPIYRFELRSKPGIA